MVSPLTPQHIHVGYTEWYTTGTQIGCSAPTYQWCTPNAPCCEAGVATLPEKFSTYPKWGFAPNVTEKEQNKVIQVAYAPVIPTTPFTSNPMAQNPWWAPGRAPVADPCGMFQGQPSFNGGKFARYQADTFAVEFQRYPLVSTGLFWGVHGTAVLLGDLTEVNETFAVPDMNTQVTHTVWQSGSTVEVSFSMGANHGGGYQYRLCSLNKLFSKDGGFDENCFQQMPLEFVGEKQWFDLNGTRHEIPATRVKEGVLPKGSTWTRNPLPACAGAAGGLALDPKNNCHEPQFEPPDAIRGIWGWASSEDQNSEEFAKYIHNIEGKGEFTIVDKIKVPENVDGWYVLGWRWDCEQTPQVWQNCAVIKIEDGLNANIASPTFPALRGSMAPNHR